MKNYETGIYVFCKATTKDSGLAQLEKNAPKLLRENEELKTALGKLYMRSSDFLEHNRDQRRATLLHKLLCGISLDKHQIDYKVIGKLLIQDEEAINEALKRGDSRS